MSRSEPFLQVCNFLSDTFLDVVQPFLCAIKSAVVTTMQTFQTIIHAISSLLGGVLDGFDNSVATVTQRVQDGFDCHMDNPFKCTQLFPADANPPSSLPLPTRCYVGYLESAGDSSGLGCTAADTCIDEDTGDFVACAACAGGTFGCDSLTKLCR